MGAIDFIQSRFIGKELCITLMDGEAEVLNYDQSSSSNREFFRGVVEEVEHGVLVMLIENYGRIYIAENFIRCFWEPPFEYYKAISVSITRKLTKARK